MLRASDRFRLMNLGQLIVARVVPQFRTSATASRGHSCYLSLSPTGRAMCVIDFDRALNGPGSSTGRRVRGIGDNGSNRHGVLAVGPPQSAHSFPYSSIYNIQPFADFVNAPTPIAT